MAERDWKKAAPVYLTWILRGVGFLAGSVALVWGAVLSARNGEPIPLIVAGLLMILLAWLGNNWEEIVAKFGDNEITVKRAKEIVDAGLTQVQDAVKSSTALPDRSRAEIETAAENARLWTERALDRLTSRINDVPIEIRLGEVRPDGSRQISIQGLQRYDWTVEKSLILQAGDQKWSIPARNGIFTYPSDWGVQQVPSGASKLSLEVDSIYGGEREVLASVVLPSSSGETSANQSRIE